MYVKGGKQSLGMLTRYFYLVLIILIPFSLYENLSLFFFFYHHGGFDLEENYGGEPAGYEFTSEHPKTSTFQYLWRQRKLGNSDQKSEENGNWLYYFLGGCLYFCLLFFLLR